MKKTENLSLLFLKCSNLKNVSLSGNWKIGCSRKKIFENLSILSSTLEIFDISKCYLNDLYIKNLSDLLSKSLNSKILNLISNMYICINVSVPKNSVKYL